MLFTGNSPVLRHPFSQVDHFAALTAKWTPAGITVPFNCFVACRAFDGFSAGHGVLNQNRQVVIMKRVLALVCTGLVSAVS